MRLRRTSDAGVRGKGPLIRAVGDFIGSICLVEKARAEERRWELEVELIEDYRLTLPPEREPLQGYRRDDHLRWRREALEHAHRQRVTERWERLRSVLTLGLWRG